jgi:predicted acyl esterase
LPPEALTIQAADGIALKGFLWRPAVPASARVPVVLASTPYGAMPDWTDDGNIPRERLVREGIAVAAFDVRGTGLSGGCFEWNGPNEARDQAVLVKRLAAMPWSNGRVGMIGGSYLSTTVVEAAVQAPTELKAIVVTGLAASLYTFLHTAQGAAAAQGPDFMRQFATDVGLKYRMQANPGLNLACPDLLRPSTTMQVGMATDERDPSFWEPRDFFKDFGRITAAVLLTHGFQDRGGHIWQEDTAWAALTQAPVWQFEGQWGHSFPGGNRQNRDWVVPDWEDRLAAWFAFWLQGRGPRPDRVGWADFQDDAGTWHASHAWPPLEARGEALYLVQGNLVASPPASDAAAAFFAQSSASWPDSVVCGDATDRAALFISEPLAEDALVAGNPFVLLNLRSDQPGGIVETDLLDVAPDGGCTDGAWQGATRLSWGFADLRFHQGNLRGTDFPVGAWTPVRIDLGNLAHLAPAGHRLVLLVGGGTGARSGQPYHPHLEVQAGSVLAVPFLTGTLDGDPPPPDVPQRPFTLLAGSGKLLPAPEAAGRTMVPSRRGASAGERQCARRRAARGALSQPLQTLAKPVRQTAPLFTGWVKPRLDEVKLSALPLLRSRNRL